MLRWVNRTWEPGLDLEEVDPYWQKAFKGFSVEDLEELKNLIHTKHSWKKAPNLAQVLEWIEESKPESRPSLGGQMAASEWKLWNDWKGPHAWSESKKAKMVKPPDCLECNRAAWACWQLRACPADSDRKFVVTEEYLAMRKEKS